KKMRGVEIADTAHEDEQRGERLLAAVEGACAQPDESKRQRRVEARGKARGIVQREKTAEEPGEESRRDEKERRLLHERLAGERRHDPVARVQDGEDQAEAVRLVGRPPVPSEESRGEPDGERRRAACPRPLLYA